MTIFEYAPSEEEILDFVNESIQQLQQAGIEPKCILLGVESYDTLRNAMSKRFNRPAGTFETYQFFPIVVDPLRKNTVCVLPSPILCATEVALHSVS